MKKFALRKTLPLAMLGVAGLALAATYMLKVDGEVTISDGDNGHKPKLMRAADGTLVSVFGDSPVGSTVTYYDTKADAEVRARDLYVKWCNPNLTDCTVKANWTKATTFAGTPEERTDGNVTNSVDKSSISTAWKGGHPVRDRLAYPGNNEKPNIKQTGPVMVLTWISQYCPDGDLRTEGEQPARQRAIRYIERDSRVIPFSCMWTAWSYNNGKTWSAPKQLSNGERDAKQDSSGGSYDLATTTARIGISWQEDPEGLQLGEGDGPGDGASGANTTGGTDVWYTWANINNVAQTATFAPPSTAVSSTGNKKDGDGTEFALGYRITDNWELEKKFGLSGQITNVLDAAGNEVDAQTVEKGNAGAARPNIGVLGNQTILAWEETKGASGLDSGKFIRYRTFKYDEPPVISQPASSTVPVAAFANEKSGCVISQPGKSGKRVRFLTQSAAEATGVTAPAVPGRSGINIAIFWREGETDKGGPSDIILRRGMVNPTAASNLQTGLATTRMVPAVDPNCATSDYAATQTLTNVLGDNISSRASKVTATDTGLLDDTEFNFLENALAHRGVLRGDDLWVGYNYVGNLYELWALFDVYDFWIRKFTFDGSANPTGGSWGLPKNVTNVKTTAVNPTNTPLNVREPRIFGTPASNATLCPTDPTFCQNRDVVYLMWGTQENCYPSDKDCGKDQGVYGTVSFDGGATYGKPVRISAAAGSAFEDDNDAFETQPQTRPDGTAFYVVFNTENYDTGLSNANFVIGSLTEETTGGGGGGGGGCTTGNGGFDPTLLLLAGLGLAGAGLRRVQRARRS